MENVNELKEYLKYLRAIVYAHLEDSRRYMDVFKVVYEKFFTLANHPDLFADMETITEIDRLHMDLQSRYYRNIVYFPSDHFNYK